MLVYQRVGLGGVNLKICPLQCLNSRFEIGLERWLGLFFFCEPHSWFLFWSRNPVSSTGHSRLLMYYEFKTFVVLNLWTSMQLIDWPFRVVDKACWSSWSFEMDKKKESQALFIQNVLHFGISQSSHQIVWIRGICCPWSFISWLWVPSKSISIYIIIPTKTNHQCGTVNHDEYIKGDFFSDSSWMVLNIRGEFINEKTPDKWRSIILDLKDTLW